MKIHGFQKLTMLDFPERIAATVFTASCNFRCPYCHNKGLVVDINSGDEISQDEILEYLKTRKGVLDGVCITGGEPLVYDDVDSFAEKVKELGLLVKLDTNGSYPDRLKRIVNRGLVDYVAMDIKNSKEKYAITAGLSNFSIDCICESVDFLLSGPCEYEFRTTMAEEYHSEDDMLDIGRWIKGAKNYYLQCFKDSGNILSGEILHAPGKDFVHHIQEKLSEFVQNVGIRGLD